MALAGGALVLLASIYLIEALVRGRARMTISSFLHRSVRLSIAVPIYGTLLGIGVVLLLTGML